jgi:hypothetical protein
MVDPSHWQTPVLRHLLPQLKALEMKATTLRSRDSWLTLRSVSFWRIKAGRRRQMTWAVLTLLKEINGLVMITVTVLLLR